MKYKNLSFWSNVSHKNSRIVIFSHFSFLKRSSVVERKITQLHFTAWPEQGRPQLSSGESDVRAMLGFISTVRRANIESGSDGSILVHCRCVSAIQSWCMCIFFLWLSLRYVKSSPQISMSFPRILNFEWIDSTGAGRSCAFVVLDKLIEAVRKESKEVNVYNTVLELRKYRPHVVETVEQYTFIYDCLLEEIRSLFPFIIKWGEWRFLGLRSGCPTCPSVPLFDHLVSQRCPFSNLIHPIKWRIRKVVCSSLESIVWCHGNWL